MLGSEIAIPGSPANLGVNDLGELASPGGTPEACNRLLDMGASIMGKAAIAQCLSSFAYDRLENPKDRSKPTLGAACGSASAVAAGDASLALATDSMGDAIFPAAACGVPCFRLSLHLTDELNMEFSARVSPTLQSFAVIAGDEGDLSTAVTALVKEGKKRHQALRRMVTPTDVAGVSSPEGKSAMASLAEAARAESTMEVMLGERLLELCPSLKAFDPGGESGGGLAACREVMETIHAREMHDFVGRVLAAKGNPRLRKLDHPGTEERLQRGASISDERLDMARRAQGEVGDALDGLIGQEGILVLPSPSTPPSSRKDEAHELERSAKAILAPAMLSGLPIAEVPMPGNACLGCAVVAGRGKDVALAKEAESMAEKAKQMYLDRETAVLRAEEERERGRECIRRGKYEEAVECYTRAIDGSAGSWAHSNRAFALLQLGRYEEAERDCTNALQIDRGDVKSLLRRGKARSALGRYSDALADFVEARRREPNNKQAAAEISQLRLLLSGNPSA